MSSKVACSLQFLFGLKFDDGKSIELLKMDAGLEHLHAVAHPPPLTPPEKGAGKA
jgi:hypothetical protein